MWFRIFASAVSMIDSWGPADWELVNRLSITGKKWITSSSECSLSLPLSSLSTCFDVSSWCVAWTYVLLYLSFLAAFFDIHHLNVDGQLFRLPLKDLLDHIFVIILFININILDMVLGQYCEAWASVCVRTFSQVGKDTWTRKYFFRWLCTSSHHA